MLELKILTPNDRFLSAVEFNYEELKDNLQTNLQKYQNLVFTEETMKDGKKTRATLNTLKTALDTKRKEIKKQCLKPYEEFESKINELIGMVDDPIVAIDIQIKAFENALEEVKKQEIILYFNEISPFGELIKIDHPCFWNEKWLNKTFKIEDVKNEIEQRVEHIKVGLENIDINLNTEFKPQIRDIFLKTFDLNKALAENNRLTEQKKKEDKYKRKQEEEKVRQEEIRQQEQAKPQVQEVKKEEVKVEDSRQEINIIQESENQSQQEIVIDNSIKNIETIKKWKTFSVEISKDEFVKIQQFLINEIGLIKDVNYKIDKPTEKETKNLKIFKISVPLDYVAGHLRDASRKYIVEANTELEAIEIAKDSDDFEIVVNDFEIEDCGEADWKQVEIKQIIK